MTKSMETVVDSESEELATTAPCGVRSFFLEEDKSVKYQTLLSVFDRETQTLFGITLGVLLLDYIAPVLDPWCILLSIFLIPISGVYLLRCLSDILMEMKCWKGLQNFPLVRQGLSRFLSGQQLSNKLIYAVRENEAIRKVFFDKQQLFVYVSEHKVCSIKLRKCDNKPTGQGGWNLLAYPSNELFRFVGFRSVPKGENTEACALQLFNEYLRATNQANRVVKDYQPVNDKVGVYYTDSQGESGLCCVCAVDNKGEGLVFLTEDERWRDFAKLWERVL